MKKSRTNIAAWIVSCWCAGLMLSSCAGRYYFYDEDSKRYFPTEPAYSLEGKFPPDSAKEMIDPHAIYLLGVPDGQSKYYTYYRFWEDGRVMYQSLVMRHFPTPADVDRLYGISMGYYTIEDSMIQIELFAPNASCHDCWYVMIEAEMVDDFLVIHRRWYRDRLSIRLRKRFRDESYQKVHMEGLTNQPDW